MSAISSVSTPTPNLRVLFGQLSPERVADISSRTSFKDWVFQTQPVSGDMVVISARTEAGEAIDPIVVTQAMSEKKVLGKLHQMAENHTVESVLKQFTVNGVIPFSPESFSIEDLKTLAETLDVREKNQAPRAKTTKALVNAFQGIANSFEYKNWQYNIKLDGERPYLQIEFMDFDSVTGEYERQTSRKYQLSPYMTDSEVIQTALLATIVTEQHEVREYFKYDDISIYGPHTSAAERVRLLSEKTTPQATDKQTGMLNLLA